MYYITHLLINKPLSHVPPLSTLSCLGRQFATRLGVNERCLRVFNYALSGLVHRHWLTFDTGAVVSLAVWQFLD
jgi:hypothetical protein